jgi:hypothetical protein
MTVSTVERTEYINDIIDTAFEGGINYWADIRGKKIMEYNDDGPVGEWITITQSLVESGIERIKHPSFLVRDDILLAILVSDRNMDASEIDIEAADVIIQAAVFGEIVYG